MRVSVVALAALTALLTACTPPALVKLQEPLNEADKAEAVVLYLEQTEVAVDDVDVQQAGGGLIGVLIEGAIESTKTRNRQEALAPLRDVLLDYDYEAQLIAALRNSLPTAMVRADAGFEIVRNEQELHDYLGKVVPANVLVVNTRYAFEQEFDVAYVFAAVQLTRYEKVPAPKSRSRRKRKATEEDKPLVLHAGAYSAQFVLSDPFARRKMGAFEGHALAWSADQAAPVREAFTAALGEIADLIRRDGNGEIPPPASGHLRAYLANPYMAPMTVRTEAVEQTSERSLLKFGQHLASVDNRQIRR